MEWNSYMHILLNVHHNRKILAKILQYNLLTDKKTKRNQNIKSDICCNEVTNLFSKEKYSKFC